MSKEIERKWLVQVKEPAVLKDWKKENLVQFYTKINEEEEVRYREKSNKYYKTIKTGNGLVREEKEEEVTQKEFEKNLENRIGNVISKVRYSKEGWELDEYLSPSMFKEYFILEREFNSIQEVEDIEFPEEIIVKKEVTNNKEFKNKNIALKGFPEE